MDTIPMDVEIDNLRFNNYNLDPQINQSLYEGPGSEPTQKKTTTLKNSSGIISNII